MIVKRAFSPTKITTIFCFNESGEILEGGFTLGRGVLVRVEAEENPEKTIETRVNGKARSLPVTREVAREILGKTPQNLSLTIDQSFEVPVGWGLGTSGASALATAIAVSIIAGVKLTYTDIVNIALRVDERLTGRRGDVQLISIGGFLVMAPTDSGDCHIIRILFTSETRVVIALLGSSGSISKLVNPKLARELYEKALRNISRDPSPETLVKESWSFAQKVGLPSPLIAKGVKIALENGALAASQVMGSNAVFALTEPEKALAVKSCLERLGARTVVTGVDSCPPRSL